MPSPFPGMDPWLENPAFWQGTHNKLITHLEEALNALLPEPYIADCELRCYVEYPTSIILPDVAVHERELLEAIPSRKENTLVVSPSYHIAVAAPEIREAYVDIIRAGGTERVVTTIELLSPTNKTTQGRGQEEYYEKRRHLLESQTHLIEIDLLRAGKHTVAVPESALHALGKYDYVVCLNRAPQRGEFEVWLNTVRRPLPCIAVPLDAGVPDVVLDLQAVFNRFYEAGYYQKRLDYTQDPIPPLTGDDAVWADALLREKGLR